MCIFRPFYFLCGCDKLQISQPCANTSTNVQGQLFCRDDPHPHIDDSVRRILDKAAHGPGVCSNLHCRWQRGVLPLGHCGGLENKTALVENDAEFDMSEEAAKEREDKWFRMLTTDQQLECMGMEFPRPAESMSRHARAHFNTDIFDAAELLFAYEELPVEELRWYELNPRYMTCDMLRYATGFLLPAEVTIPGHWKEHASTPHKPLEGPFKVGKHTCYPNPGVCGACGRHAGDPEKRDEQISIEVENLMHWREMPMRPSKTLAWFQQYVQDCEEDLTKLMVGHRGLMVPATTVQNGTTSQHGENKVEYPVEYKITKMASSPTCEAAIHRFDDLLDRMVDEGYAKMTDEEFLSLMDKPEGHVENEGEQMELEDASATVQKNANVQNGTTVQNEEHKVDHEATKMLGGPLCEAALPQEEGFLAGLTDDMEIETNL